MSPNSSLNLPQNAFGVAAPPPVNEEGGTVAKGESDQRDSGDNTLAPISRVEVAFRGDPGSCLPEIKKEERFKGVGHVTLVRGGPLCRRTTNEVVGDGGTETTHEYSVNVRHIEALKAECARITEEVTARQNAMVNRVSRIEGHLDTLARDQNNALESNQ